MEIPFYVLRVFVNKNGEFGNPVGIIVDDKKKLPVETRQKIASKIGFSESVFINNLATGNISLFSPVREVNFAGHAIIGTVYYLSQKSGGKLTRLECNTGRVEFWQDRNITWIHAGLKGTPSWRHEQLSKPETIENLSVSEMASEEHVMVWAWIDKDKNIVRARTFAADWGIPEDQGNGSGSMQLAVRLGKTLEIHHGKGSVIYAKPAGTDCTDVGGVVKEDGVQVFDL